MAKKMKRSRSKENGQQGGKAISKSAVCGHGGWKTQALGTDAGNLCRADWHFKPSSFGG